MDKKYLNILEVPEVDLNSTDRLVVIDVSNNIKVLNKGNLSVDLSDYYTKEATNELLMIKSMAYFYEIIRVNKEESEEIDRWITQVRIELKKNIIRKQNRDINNKEMYAYLHDVLGPEVIDLFDRRYEESKGDT